MRIRRIYVCFGLPSYASSPIQNMLGITSDEVYFYMFLFLVFGVFSILSGLLLIQEKNCED